MHLRRRTRKTVATTTLTPKRRCSGRSRGHNHARTTLPHVCQSGGSKAIPTPTAAAMSVPALAAAAAVSDGGGNSGEPGDDGDWQSNSSTGGAPPLKDTKPERNAPSSAWASGQLAAARLNPCTQHNHCGRVHVFSYIRILPASCGIRTHDLPLTKRVLYQLS